MRSAERAAPRSDVALLIPWLAALLGYFAPWVGRRPMSAALAWNAYDLFDLLRLLPQIERGGLTVNLQALHLPLLGLAVLLPVLLAQSRTTVRWGAALLSCGLAAMTLPPYPQILDAWRTPGWRVTFWWAIGAMACTVASLWFAPRLGRYRSWWIIGVVGLAILPAISTLYRLLPAMEMLHQAQVWPGWGAWTSVAGLSVIGLAIWLQRVRRVSMKTKKQPNKLKNILAVKAKYESALLKKANVVGVGVGIAIRNKEPADEIGIIVNVSHKVDEEELTPKDRVPESLEGVRVWVEEIGHPHAQDD